MADESPVTTTNHKKMNICILTSSFPAHPDDIVQAPFLIDFIEGLRRRKHQVFIFTQDRNGEKKEFLEGVNVKWFPWLKSKKPLVHLNPLNPLNFVRIGSLFRMGQKGVIPFVKENKIDACLALWVLPGGYFANYAYRKAGIPYSVWALGSDIYRYGKNPFLRPLMKRIICEARGVFADGFDLARRVEQRFGRKSDFLATTRRITHSPSLLTPPNPPLLKGGEGGLLKGGQGGLALQKGYKDGLSEIPYHFLFVGRLEKVKGIDLLLRAMALLKKENLNFHLTVVGTGGMEEWAKSFSKQEGIEDGVTFTGTLSDLSLASLYQSSNCVVIPSRSESIPLVFSEALRFDKELIVTDVGDMGMLGRQYEVAEVVPPENPVAIKEALKKKLKSQKDPGKEEKREELLKLFDIETSVDRFLEDYKERDS